MWWYLDKNFDNKEVVEERFKFVFEVYEVLFNKDKCEIYDRYGKEGFLVSLRKEDGEFVVNFEMFFLYVFCSLEEVFREFFGIIFFDDIFNIVF